MITYEVTLPESHPLAYAGNVNADVLPVKHRQKMATLGRDWKFQTTAPASPGRRKLVFHAEKPPR